MILIILLPFLAFPTVLSQLGTILIGARYIFSQSFAEVGYDTSKLLLALTVGRNMLAIGVSSGGGVGVGRRLFIGARK